MSILIYLEIQLGWNYKSILILMKLLTRLELLQYLHIPGTTTRLGLLEYPNYLELQLGWNVISPKLYIGWD